MSIFTDFAIPHIYRFDGERWVEAPQVGLQMFECVVCKALTLDFAAHMATAHASPVADQPDRTDRLP